MLLAGPQLRKHVRKDPVAQVPQGWPLHHVTAVCPLACVVVPALACHLLLADALRARPLGGRWARGAERLCQVREVSAAVLLAASRVLRLWIECAVVAAFLRLCVIGP